MGRRAIGVVNKLSSDFVYVYQNGSSDKAVGCDGSGIMEVLRDRNGIWRGFVVYQHRKEFLNKRGGRMINRLVKGPKWNMGYSYRETRGLKRKMLRTFSDAVAFGDSTTSIIGELTLKMFFLFSLHWYSGETKYVVIILKNSFGYYCYYLFFTD